MEKRYNFEHMKDWIKSHMALTACIAIGIVLLVCNFLLLPVSDDFNHIAMGREFGWQGAIITYQNWTARLGEMLICSYLSCVSQWLFDILNTIFGMAFILLFFVLIVGRMPKSGLDALSLLCIFLCIICFNAFGSVFLWYSGAVNYLWGLTFIAAAVLPYRLYWNNSIRNKQQSPIFSNRYAIPLFILSLLAGMCSEQIGIIVIGVQVLLLLFAIVRKEKLPLWYYVGVIGFIIGWCFLFFSPGESSRNAASGQYITPMLFLQMSFSEQFHRFVYAFQQFHSKQYMAFVFFIIAYFVIHIIKNKIWIKSLYAVGILGVFMVLVKSGLCVIPTLTIFSIFMCVAYQQYHSRQSMVWISIAALMFLYVLCCCSGTFVSFPMRAKFGGDCFLIAIMIVLFREWYPKMLPRIHNVSQICISIIFCVASLFVVSAYLIGHVKWRKVEQYINEQKMQGNMDIVISKSVLKSYYPFYGEWVNPDADALTWPNNEYAKWYGVNSFIVK